MRFDDKEFLQTPEKWPGGVCCMKRRLDTSDRKLEHDFGQFTTSGATGLPTVVVIDLKNMQKVREESYSDLDALLVEWMVD